MLKFLIGILLFASSAYAQPAPPTGGGVGTPPSRFVLTVTKVGNGTGTITAPGITCGPDCGQTINAGVSITLTAVPTNTSTFVGWSGSGCSGTGTCVVVMSQARTVTANFNFEVKLAWNDNATDETAQELERRSPCGSGTFSLLQTIAADVTTYIDQTAIVGNQYGYRIRATNSGGPSGYSNILCVP